MMRIFVSNAASERLAKAAEFIGGFPASTEVLILANSRDAADDFVRGISKDQHATFGLHGYSLNRAR